MATSRGTSHTRRIRRGPIAVLVAATIFTSVGATMVYLNGSDRPAQGAELDLDGRDALQPDSTKPKITAAFPREGYRPGSLARLDIYSHARGVTIQFFHAGLEASTTNANDVMLGAPVGRKRWIGNVNPGQKVPLRIGSWPSGVYFLQLTAGTRVGYAPFVLRPGRLGRHRVAVVMPTMSWQAYNFRDDDGDGSRDTWYAGGETARLGRPFLNRGVPYHYKYYDAPFLRWLARTGHEPDYLSDADLRQVSSGRLLAQRYALLIFPGHHEYVTQHEFDVVRSFRNRGGNLMYLSANNFFWKTVIHGSVMRRIVHWRDIGYSEADLTGVGYFHNDLGEHRGRWVVRTAIPWLFAGTDLRRGSKFSSGGIEADRVYSTSPANTQIVAEIPNLYGPGMTAQMTYYERGGAKVFAAGAFTLACSVWERDVRHIVENLWDRLANDRDTAHWSQEPPKDEQ